ncbi:ATP-grasp domain-containing protein [Streptomyces sp. DSM 44915]|uniref:ATP-grasp domain-containing protein n=1 Tax=Streptomyces chisholmiae TaxID=3075540 RepID=A0ABU2JU47_9ACTN|nr:ATP-grasp domain-containing protein [Streptomyces sp. DSM 44915]MDT0268503.1 ATP-grasp domain-containing protein [Streptomyces sp. DSM 44915]
MTIAIVDAYGAGRLLPEALRSRGVEAVHVRSARPDTRLAYRPEDFAVDLRYGGDLAATCRELRALGVTGVVAAAESGVRLADQLAAALGVPGNDLVRSPARRDKFAMREAVRAAGLATAASRCGSALRESLDWARAHGRWPVVLKPSRSAGADHVFVCHSLTEVADAHTRIMAAVNRYGERNEVVLAQEFLVGTEHYVNTVSHDGRHRVVEVWRYHKRLVDGRSVYDYEDLLALDEPGVRELVDYVRAVLDALGIREGAAHTEVMRTAAGPVLIECGARLGGGQTPALLTRCVGADQVNSLAYAIAEPAGFLAEAEAPYQLKSRLRCVNLISPRAGRVPADAGWQPVRELPSFAELVLNAPAGSRLTRTVDMATCPGTVYLSHDDPAVLAADHRALREWEVTWLYAS